MNSLPRTIFHAILLLLVTFNTAYASKDGKQEKGFRIISCTDSTLLLEYDLPNYVATPIAIGSNTYYLVSFPEGYSTGEAGNPDLPTISKSICVPVNANCNVQVENGNFEDIQLSIAPSRGTIYRKNNPDDIPYTFSDAYLADSFFPQDIATLGKPYMLRDVRGCVLSVSPFQYNPAKKTLRVYNSITIKVCFSGTNHHGEIGEKVTSNSAFENIYRHHFLNYPISPYCNHSSQKNVRRENNSRHSPYRDQSMLVVCCDSFISEMRNFVIHKNNIGLQTSLVPMSEIGNTCEDIATFIRDAYESDNNLTYVLLVGNVERVPAYYEHSSYSDPYYSLVSDEDNYPDIFVGRFSAYTKQDVKTMVDRTIEYENLLDAPWMHRAIGIADEEEAYGLNDYIHMRQIGTELLNSHYTDFIELYDGNHGGTDLPGYPAERDVVNAVNCGASLLNYCAEGADDEWLTTEFSNEWVDTLSNVGMLPFIYSVACDVGLMSDNTDDTPCLAESWLRAQKGRKPIGAVGFYGSSIVQPWVEPIVAHSAFIDMLINEEYTTFGSLCFSSACTMMDYFHSDDADEVFLYWNVFGDPSISVIPNNQVGQTIFINDSITGDSIYQKKYIDIYDATIIEGTNIEIDHTHSTIINGPFRVKTGARLSIH